MIHEIRPSPSHCRELRVDQRRDLRGRDAEQRRPHCAQHARDALVAPVERRPRQHPELGERTDLQRELRDAADRDAPGQRHDRRIDMRREKDRGADDREIEQHRRERGNGEPSMHVQHAAGERHQRDEQDVGKDDADQVGRELDLPRRPLEAGGEQVDEPGRGEDAEHGHDQQGDGKQRPDAPDEVARRLGAALALVFGEDRHERLRERAFGEHAAQDVRQPECGLERVHLDARAEQHGLQALAHEAGDSRQQRHAADRRQRLQQVHERKRLPVTPRESGRASVDSRLAPAPDRPGRRHARAGKCLLDKCFSAMLAGLFSGTQATP